MSITVTVKHHFSAGHRLPGLSGPGAKCANLHGHTFGVEWTYLTNTVSVEAIEFASVKRTLRALVDEYFDHGYIIGHADELVPFFVMHGFKHYVLTDWPSTEAIAQEIARWSHIDGAVLASVTVTEGPHNAATWINDDADA